MGGNASGSQRQVLEVLKALAILMVLSIFPIAPSRREPLLGAAMNLNHEADPRGAVELASALEERDINTKNSSLETA